MTEWGVDRSAIKFESKSRTTYENAVYTREILVREGIKRILLVTSASHMRRALATFRSADIDAWPAPTDHQIVESQAPWPLGWLPDDETLFKTRRAIKERIGFQIYKFRGWITDEGLVPPDWSQ